MTVAIPFTPSAVAVIVATPAETAVTRPDDETVAIAGSLDTQVAGMPAAVPPAFLRKSSRCCRLPLIGRHGVKGRRWCA